MDQFEEIFTLCQDSAERTRFLDGLLHASRPEVRLRVVVAVRADHYGGRLATGSTDGTARLWDLTLRDAAHAVDEICAAVHRDLTPLERATYPGSRRDSACPA